AATAGQCRPGERERGLPRCHPLSREPAPSDGMHIVWTTLLGLNRGRYFLLTGQTIDAREALRLGVVGEVLAPARLLERAWQLAASWTRHSSLTLRGTRTTLTTEWRRLLNEQLHSGTTYQ